MKIRLDHVAVAVRDIKEAIDTFERTLGLTCEKVQTVPTESSTVAFFDLGGPHLELVAPDDPDSPLGRSLDKRGEGLHHICVEVEDIEVALGGLRESGARIVGEAPRPGAGGTKVAFVHPKSMHGVLVELVEKP